MFRTIMIVLFFVAPCFAVSPAEQWVIDNWLAVDGSGDLNNDGICDANDAVLAQQHDITKIVIWGKTEGILKNALQVAIDEANYQQNPRYASIYRKELTRILKEEGYFSDPNAPAKPRPSAPTSRKKK